VDFSSFFSDVVVAIVGGSILTILFFLVREKIFGFVDMNGSWVYEQKTETSDYVPYKEITLTYLVLLGQNGNQIYGSAEKVREMPADGMEKNYVGKDRTNAEISGHIEKKYFSKDVVSIHIKENGKVRVSSTFHILKFKSKDQLQGRFSSTIANQLGSAKWSRRSS